jgi:5-enolpyruvylshikimate-3-phosphate synthase
MFPVSLLVIYTAGEGSIEGSHDNWRYGAVLIDEFPILCAAASLAEGTTTAKELKSWVKESDRIKTITLNEKNGSETMNTPTVSA